jgi:hypothetical protein
VTAAERDAHLELAKAWARLADDAALFAARKVRGEDKSS